MRKRWAVLFVGLAFWLVPARALPAAEEPFSSGKDWLKHMSLREKYISLLAPTIVFERHDVQLRRSLPEYIYLIDGILLRNPQLEREEISNIFASTVYLVEPQNREALKNMEMQFLSGNFETNPYQAPRLTVEDILRENSPAEPES